VVLSPFSNYNGYSYIWGILSFIYDTYMYIFMHLYICFLIPILERTGSIYIPIFSLLTGLQIKAKIKELKKAFSALIVKPDDT
jgi:hypothetical protein